MSAPSRYKSRPVEVTAMQWTGDRGGVVALRSWMDQKAHQSGLDYDAVVASLWVAKAGRWIALTPGDFVVAEPDGIGFYPCKRDIFEDRYVALGAVTEGQEDQHG